MTKFSIVRKYFEYSSTINDGGFVIQNQTPSNRYIIKKFDTNGVSELDTIKKIITVSKYVSINGVNSGIAALSLQLDLYFNFYTPVDFGLTVGKEYTIVFSDEPLTSTTTSTTTSTKTESFISKYKWYLIIGGIVLTLFIITMIVIFIFMSGKKKTPVFDTEANI